MKIYPYSAYETSNVNALFGKTISHINVSHDRDVIEFTLADGAFYQMYHEGECCETVEIEDIIGDLDDLIGAPILMAEESTNIDEEAYEYAMWTFYKLATIKGYVTLRWYGESNGYYSVGVNFDKVNR